MTNNEPVSIRWNAMHDSSIKVFCQDHPDEQLRLDAEYFGIEVFSNEEGVARMFSETAKVWTPHQIDVIEATARRNGDRVFYLEYGEHSAFGFRLHRHDRKGFWFGRCVGILVARRCTWPETVFYESYVFRVLDKVFSERGCAVLNGWIFEAVVTTKDETICYRDHLSEAEALADAQRDFPDVKYRDKDFKLATVYQLAV